MQCPWGWETAIKNLLTNRTFLFAVFVVCISVVIALADAYVPDHDLDELTAKYSYSDSQYRDFEGMRVHYRDVGSGTPVVLLHGLSSSLHTWEGWTNHLSKDFRVITIDLPGFGLTGPFVPQQEYAIPTYVAWLHRFLEDLGLQKFHLGGNSFGGNLSWRYTAAHPENVDKLILVNSAGFSLAGAGLSVFKVAGTRGAGWLVKNFTPKSIVKLSVLRIYGDKSKVDDALIERYYDLFLRPGNRESLVSYLIGLKWERTDLLSTIDKPTAVMWGTEDALIPIDHADRFMQLLPNAELIKYEGVGHVPMEEIAAQSAQDIEAFLKAH